MSQQIKNTELLSAVAKRLKNLRSEKSLSQEEVYNDTEIHIARIETGKFNISISTLDALCEYYSISLEKFFSEGFENVQTKP
jgi:transcriptional regulator with XRE-family HTH domain